LPDSPNVTVIGLGRMGQAATGRLLDAGLAPTVWNRTPGRAGPLTDRGAVEAASLQSAAEHADVVLTFLSGDAAVADVLLPKGAPRDGLRGVVIDCSTVSPATSGALAAAYDSRFVACPIAGAPAQMRDGHAMLLVAGGPGARERAEPVLAALSDTRIDAGPDVSHAALSKVLNNYLLLGGLAILADAVRTAQAAGLPDDYLRQFLGQSPVVPPGLANRLEHLIAHEHEPWFTVDLGAKDLGLYTELAISTASGSDVAAAVVERYAAAQEAKLGDQDISAVVEVAAPTEARTTKGRS
jgi:3-hydroxyisobutyrate dehydrogenase-like beta-hydroxyacid dehydrogenase